MPKMREAWRATGAAAVYSSLDGPVCLSTRLTGTLKTPTSQVGRWILTPLTPQSARELAAQLIKAADTAEGRRK